MASATHIYWLCGNEELDDCFFGGIVSGLAADGSKNHHSGIVPGFSVYGISRQDECGSQNLWSQEFVANSGGSGHCFSRRFAPGRAICNSGMALSNSHRGAISAADGTSYGTATPNYAWPRRCLAT